MSESNSSMNQANLVKVSPTGDADATLSALGVGAGQAMPPMLDGLSGSRPKKRLHLSAISMVLAVMMAGGLLVGMRQLGLGPKFASAKDGPEIQLPGDNKMHAANQELILAELNASRTTNQVPQDRVKKNPFKIAFALGLPSEMTPVAAKPGDKADPEAIRMAKLAKKKMERAKDIAARKLTLKLQSVLNGTRPVARINGTVFRVGDTVEDYFTIKSISGRSVELEVDDELFTIDMTEGKSK